VPNIYVYRVPSIIGCTNVAFLSPTSILKQTPLHTATLNEIPNSDTLSSLSLWRYVSYLVSIGDDPKSIRNNNNNNNNASTIERAAALRYLENTYPPNSSKNDIKSLFFYFRREVYLKSVYIWCQDTEGYYAKLL